MIKRPKISLKDFKTIRGIKTSKLWKFTAKKTLKISMKSNKNSLTSKQTNSRKKTKAIKDH